MVIKQLSVFLENKKGRLFAAADVLAKSGVNIRALSLADTAEFGILRLIVDRPEEAKRLLTDSGVFVRVTDVLAVKTDDAPGGTIGALRILSEEGINVEYMYACVGQKTGKALMMLQVDQLAKAEKILREGGFGQVTVSDFD